MRVIITFTILVLSSNVFALPPKPSSETQSRVYHNATIHIGNGEVLENATIAFDKGVITRVGHFRMAWQEGDINLKGKHVYPGFILPVTNVGLSEVGAIKATKDDTETGSLNSNVRSIVAYNTDSEITPTLRFNGILLAQPTPQGGLVSGLSSVVQLDAWNWEDAAVVVDDGLHINWPNAMQNKFDFATFSMKLEKNNKYSEQIANMKSLFQDAKRYTQDDKTSINLKLSAVKPVFTSGRKVYIHTSNPKGIIESVTFLKEQGINNIVLVTDQNAEPVIGFIKESHVPVIVTGVHTLPVKTDSSVDSGYTIAVKLAEAGVLTAISYPSAMGSRNLAFTAGSLAAYGLGKEQALKMISANPARILGIDKKYGTLEVGKSATLFITEGDALDMRGNILTEAYIDGRKIELEGRQQKLFKRYSEKYKL